MAQLPSILTITLLFLCFTAHSDIQGSSARSLPHPPPPPPRSLTHHHPAPSLAFLIHDVLSSTTIPTYPPLAAAVNDQHQLPFSKPLVGLLPPIPGIPLPKSSNSIPSSIGMAFPAARAAFQELEFGTVTAINEDLFQDSDFGLQIMGKALGIYVATLEDGSSHIMAMTASFGKLSDDEESSKHSLRFFGVHRKDVSECHVAVIGGTGEYDGANGYATVKMVVDRASNSNANATEAGIQDANSKLLHFNVYLS